MKECTFKPKINNNISVSSNKNLSFYKRNIIWKSMKNNKLHRLYSKLNNQNLIKNNKSKSYNKPQFPEDINKKAIKKYLETKKKAINKNMNNEFLIRKYIKLRDYSFFYVKNFDINK